MTAAEADQFMRELDEAIADYDRLLDRVEEDRAWTRMVVLGVLVGICEIALLVVWLM